MTIYTGSTEAYKVYVGSTRVEKVYQGADLLHNKYVVEHIGTLSAADEAEWSTTGTGSISRVNSNTEFRITSSFGGTAYIDLWNHVSDGDKADIAFYVVSVDPGDSILAGLDGSSGFPTFTSPFSTSPLTSANNASTAYIANQTIDSTRRYLKIQCDSGEGLNIQSVLVWRT